MSKDIVVIVKPCHNGKTSHKGSRKQYRISALPAVLAKRRFVANVMAVPGKPYMLTLTEVSAGTDFSYAVAAMPGSAALQFTLPVDQEPPQGYYELQQVFVEGKMLLGLTQVTDLSQYTKVPKTYTRSGGPKLPRKRRKQKSLVSRLANWLFG